MICEARCANAREENSERSMDMVKGDLKENGASLSYRLDWIFHPLHHVSCLMSNAPPFLSSVAQTYHHERATAHPSSRVSYALLADEEKFRLFVWTKELPDPAPVAPGLTAMTRMQRAGQTEPAGGRQATIVFVLMLIAFVAESQLTEVNRFIMY